MPSAQDCWLQLRCWCIVWCCWSRPRRGVHRSLAAADASQSVWLYKVEPSGGLLLGMNKVSHALYACVPNGTRKSKH